MKRSEKSNQKKIKVRWPISVITGRNIIEGVTRNITDAGILILSKEPLRMNELYRITVRLPNYLDRMLTCKVIWSNLYGINPVNEIYGMGYCFLQASNRDRMFLTDVVSDFPGN